MDGIVLAVFFFLAYDHAEYDHAESRPSGSVFFPLMGVLLFVPGQHRWVEYADIQNYDSSSVTAAWHPWLHHMSDHTPSAAAQVRVRLHERPQFVVDIYHPPSKRARWGFFRCPSRLREVYIHMPCSFGTSWFESGSPTMRGW